MNVAPTLEDTLLYKGLENQNTGFNPSDVV